MYKHRENLVLHRLFNRLAVVVAMQAQSTEMLNWVRKLIQTNQA